MNRLQFYRMYLPALEKALEKDISRDGYVYDPLDFVDTETATAIDNYLTENEDKFTETVAYYFDALTHNFESIQGVNIQEYKNRILREIHGLKSTLDQ